MAEHQLPKLNTRVRFPSSAPVLTCGKTVRRCSNEFLGVTTLSQPDSKSARPVEDVQNELEELTGRRTVDAVLDCAGSAESLGLAASILATEGALSQVGLMGQRVELPVFPFVSGEKSYFGSFWGNYNDLKEVLTLASKGLVKHHVVPVKLDDINETLEA
jgi:D-arabinose 1-dehydrogenase-like Zn-dependent alcohol dehydrogenase